MEGILELGQALVGSACGAVALCGALHAGGLVRSFLVEFFEKVIEAGLLLQAVRAGRSGGFLFEGEVHALMAPVLLRVSWLVGDGQGVTVMAVAELELALEAGAPEVVGAVASESAVPLALLRRHRRAGHETQTFFRYRTLLPWLQHPQPNGQKCYPCVRYVALPISQVGQLGQSIGRAAVACRRMAAKILRAALSAVLLLLATLPAGACAAKVDRAVAWCQENHAGYGRDDCVRQMRRNYDGR